MTTDREQIIAAAREAGFGALTPYGESCTEKLYAIAFAAGEASRDADNAELVVALELIAGTDPFEAALDPQRAVRVARSTLAKVRKP